MAESAAADARAHGEGTSAARELDMPWHGKQRKNELRVRRELDNLSRGKRSPSWGASCAQARDDHGKLEMRHDGVRPTNSLFAGTSLAARDENLSRGQQQR